MEGVVMEGAAGFWRGRRVLVTGHTGFKGAWLSLWLQEAGARVTGFALDPATEPSFFGLAGVGAGMDSVIGDLRDAGDVADAVGRARPEMVFHLAAQSLVRRSYADPAETYAVNVMGTVNLLEAVRRTPGVRAVAVVTTDKCYENREWPWPYRETDAMGGWDPYSSSKACVELLCSSWRRSFLEAADPPIALATARAGNVIGGGDYAVDRLLPDLVRAALDGKPAVIRNPDAIRPWQHVLDPLTGYLRLGERLLEDGAGWDEGWNFGPATDEELTVGAVADAFIAAWGDGAGWRTDDGAHPHEARELRLDSSKARARLGWAPRWAADEALRRTVSWYRSVHLEAADPRALAVAAMGDHGSLETPVASG